MTKIFDKDIILLKELIEARFGLCPRQEKAKNLAASLASMAREKGTNPSDLATAAISDPFLQLQLAGALTVNESYFFRHPSHMGVLRRLLMKRIPSLPPGATFRILSAGCSSGEEPHTVAILSHELLTDAQRDRLEIIGVDLNAEAIRTGTSGKYGQWSLRESSPATIARYFEPTGKQEHTLKDRVLRMVRFVNMDLLDYCTRVPPGSIDLILFRNVSIYLEPAHLQDLYESFARVLSDNGVLLLSATDVLPSRDLFSSDTGDRTPNVLIQAPSTRDTYQRDTIPARPNHTVSATSFAKPAPHLPPVAAESGGERPLAEAIFLANKGESDRAMGILNSRISLWPDDVSARVLRSQICLALEEPCMAQTDLEHAVTLDPDNSEARYWFALALHETGDDSSAGEQIEQILHNCGARINEGSNLPGDTHHLDIVSAALTLKERLT